MTEEKTIELEKIPFNDNPDIEERYSEHWTLFQNYKEEKEQTVKFFNKNGVDRNIYDYVNDSVERMNEHHLKPNWKEDWQNNVFDPITRNKLIAILSKLASARLKPEILVKPMSIFNNINVTQKKRIFSDLLENANVHNQDEERLIWEMYTAMTEGTVIGYEGWSRDTKEVEYVKEYDPETGDKKTETIKVDSWDDVFGEIVPIEEFFPETIWVNANDFKKKIKRVFRVREMTFSQFQDAYGKFKGADTVQTAGYYFARENFDWGIPADIHADNVFVMEFYDEKRDRMGVWVNGKELYYGCLPFNHKRLPFWIAIFEPIHHQLLFGKSLPDKMMGMQDINNSIFNSMLDQLYISLNSPIFADGEVDINEGYLEPGRIIEMTPGTTVTRGSLGQVDQAAFQTLQLIKGEMEEASVSAQAQGIPSGGRKTKFEVQQLQEAALDIASLFLQLMERSMSQKYLLRMYNILQYYSMPSRIKTGKKKFKFIVIENAKLENGKTGKKMLQIVDSKLQIPSKDELREVAEKEEGKKFNAAESQVEPIVISRDYLSDKELELEIRIVPNSSIKMSEVDKKNKDIAFFQAVAENPLFDQEEVARDFARAFDKSEEIVKKPEMQGAGQGQTPGLPGLPGGTNGQAAPGKGQPDLDLL